jgi:hypothetical protein
MKVPNKTLCKLSDDLMEKMSALADLFSPNLISAEGITFGRRYPSYCNDNCSSDCTDNCYSNSL